MQRTLKKFTNILMVSVLVLALSNNAYPNRVLAFAGGDGTSGDPYLIESCEQLAELDDNSADMSSYFKLTNDIVCSDTVNWNGGQGWAPLADFANKFSGTLDGDGHNITNLYSFREPAPGLGLFSYVENATFKNFSISGTMTNSTDNLGSCSGAIAAGVFGSITIENVSSTVNISGEQDSIGGLVGCILNGTGASSITDSSVNADLNLGAIGGLVQSVDISDAASLTINNSTSTGSMAGLQTGGLIGQFIYRTWDTESSGPALIISNSGSSADIVSTGSSGGLIDSLALNHRGADIQGASFTGTIDVSGGSGSAGLINTVESFENGASTTSINQSYASTSIVSATDDVGGLVGRLADGHSLTIDESFFGGVIDATGDRVGGLIADADGALTVTNSYSDAQLDGDDYIGGILGAGTGDIQNSFAVGNIASTKTVLGGLAGSLTDGTIADSFAAMSIDSTWPTTVGGLVGGIDGGTIDNSYVDIGVNQQGCNTTGNPENPSIIDCQTVDSSEDQNYFFDNATNQPLNQWNFDSVWETNQYFYPCLQWQDTCQTFEPQMVCEMPASTESSISGACDIQVRSGYDYGTTTWIARYKQVGDDEYQEVPLDSEQQASATITDLLPNTDYYLEFQFTNNWGTSEWGRMEITTQDATEDFNGDGILDYLQPNISSYISSITNKRIVIDVGNNCELVGDDMTDESNFEVADIAYEYENGLFEFVADCNVTTTTIKLYYYDVDPTGLVARKYSTITKSYFNLADAVITSQNIDGHSVAVVTYQLTDNSERDMEPELGVIEDPAGLARQVLGVPNTGLSKQ